MVKGETLDVDNKVITDNEEKAKAFNGFFLTHSHIDDSTAELLDNGGGC